MYSYLHILGFLWLCYTNLPQTQDNARAYPKQTILLRVYVCTEIIEFWMQVPKLTEVHESVLPYYIPVQADWA
jgi:hypothetical protein